MAEGTSSPEQSENGLRSFIEKAKIIKSNRNKGNKDAVLRAAVEQAREESEIDTMTGLPNKRGFDKRLKEEVERSLRTQKNGTIMVLDLDGLKKINDSRGHDAGSEYIKKAAKTFREGLRLTDFIARTGGDEFIAILPDTTPDQTTKIWDERLEPELIKEGVAVSAGAHDLNPSFPDESAKQADNLMYLAKGRSTKNLTALMVKPTQRNV